MSKVYQLHLVQRLPASLEKVWDFFRRPENLKTITPDYMGFQVKSSSLKDSMYAGQIIEYAVTPLLNISMYWMTEITHVEEGKYFVDEQRFGPYSFWHHQHHFREIEGGVEMTDLLHYKIPYWFIGNIANSLLVKKKLKEIFDFRYKKAEEIFGRFPS
jgi:ligand-binding SRPBCC domain-containing protein